MRILRTLLTIPLLGLAALGADEKGDPARKPASSPAPPIATIRKAAPLGEFDPAREADALAFVREHHPELASVVEALKPRNPDEYRKAILELSQTSRTLAELQARNPRRHELALDGWKARSRVELLAAQLHGSPGEELRSQLRTAIEAKVESDIRRQRFELDQAEAAAKKARESLDRLENHRDSIVEARFRALQPKKLAKAKKPATTVNPKTNPPSAETKPASPPAQGPNGEDR